MSLLGGELYYSYLFTALDRADPSELKKIWNMSLSSKEGDVIRTLIMKKLPTIAKVNSLPEVETLKELYDSYRRRKLERRVNHMPFKWMKYYLEKEDISALKYYLKTHSLEEDDDNKDEMSSIVGTKSLSFVKEYLALNFTEYPEYSYAYILDAAIMNKNIEVIEYILSLLTNLGNKEPVYESMLEAGAESGQWGWIFFAIQNIGKGDNFVLMRAAKGGHEDIIQFFLKSNNNKYYLARGYILGKHITEAKHVIEEEISKEGLSEEEFDKTLKSLVRTAVSVRDKETIEYLMKKMHHPEKYVQYFLWDSVKENLDLVEYIYNKQEEWKNNELIDALSLAIYTENIPVVKFLLEKGADISEYEDTIEEMQRLLRGEI